MTKYIWDGENCLMETDGNGAVQTVYTYEPEQYGNLISSRVSGTTYYHHYDALGSTRQLSNAAGTVSDTWIYDAWGNTVARTGATAIFLQWVGQVGYYYDPETGTFWVRERPLEPANARWTTVDPAVFVDGIYRFIYAKNGPVMRIDPSGLESETPSIDIITFGECNKLVPPGPNKLGSIGDVTGKKIDIKELSKYDKDKYIVNCYLDKDGDIRCGYIFNYTFKCKCDENIVQMVTTVLKFYDKDGKEIQKVAPTGFIEVFPSPGTCDQHFYVGSITKGNVAKGLFKRCVEKTLVSCCGTYAGKKLDKPAKTGTVPNPSDAQMKCSSKKKTVTIKFCFDNDKNTSLETSDIDSGDIDV